MAFARGSARWIVAAVFLALAVVVSAAVQVLEAPRFANRICAGGVRLLGKSIGLEASLQSCKIDPFDVRVRLAGFRAVDAEDAGRTVAIDSIDARLNPFRALASGLWIERLLVSGVSVAWRTGSRSARGRKSGAPARGPCWVRLLRWVHVEHLDLQGGPMIGDLGGGSVTLAKLAAKAHLENGHYRGTIEASGTASPGDGRTEGIRRVSVEADLDPRHEELEIRSAGLESDSLRISVSGRVRHLCDPAPDLSFEVVAPVASAARWLAPRQPGAAGTVSVAGRWKGGADISAKVRVVAAALGGYRLGDASAEIALGPHRLEVSALRIALDEGGEVNGRGRIDLGGRLPLSFDVSIRNGDLARTLDRAQILHCLVDLKFDGTAHVSGHLLGGALLTGEMEGDVRGLTVHDFGWDRPVRKEVVLAEPMGLHVTSSISIDRESFRFERARIRGGGTDITADASIYYDNKRGLKLEAKAGRLSLSEFGSIAGIPWAGEGTASVGIAGSYSEPQITGHAELDGFRFFHLDLGHVASDVRSQGTVLSFPIFFGKRGGTSYSGAGSIDFDRNLWVDGEVDVPSGRLEDLTAAVQGLDASLPAVHDALGGVFSGHARVRGPLLRADAAVEIDLGDFRVFGRRLEQGAVSARLVQGTRVVIDSLSARAGGGHFEGDGEVDVSGRLSLRGRAEGVAIGPLLAPAGGVAPATGTLSLSGQLTGTLSQWLPGGSARIQDFTVLGVPLGVADTRFQTERRVLRLVGKAGDETTLDGTLRLEHRGPYTASIGAQSEHLERYLAGYGFRDPPSGTITGTLSLQGDILDPERSRGEFDLSRLTLSRQALRIHNQGELRLGLDGTALVFRQAVFSGTNTLFVLSGTRGAAGELNLSGSGKLDARLLDGIVPHVERLGGVVDARASVSGTFSDPSIIGTASFHQGHFLWSDWPLSVTGLEGSAEFSERKVVIDGARGDLNGGSAELSGEARLRGLQVERCDIDARLKDVPLRVPETIPSMVSGHLSLFGVVDDGLVMSGDLHVVRARWARDLEIDQLLSAWRRRANAEPYQSRPDGPPLRLDIRLHGDGDIRLEGDFAQLALSGDLRLTGTSASPGLLGSVSGRDGLAQFRGNQYRVANASFTFGDPDRISPVFDINADTETRQYRVFVHAYGTPADYKLSLRSQPELSEDDIVKLMTFGITSRDTAQAVGAAGDVGYGVDVLWNLSGMQQQVKRIIPKNPLIREFSFNVGSAFLESTGQVEPVAQIESKLLTDRLRLHAQLPLSVSTGNRVEAEYRLGDHVSLSGEWNNDYSDYNFGDLGLDLRMRWEIGD